MQSRPGNMNKEQKQILPLQKLPGMAFIVGMPRSGTTLLTNMLNSHPNLISTPENEFVLFAHASFQNKDFRKEREVDAFLDIFKYDFNTEPSIWVPDKKIKEDIKQIEQKNFANLCKLAYLNYPLAGEKQNVEFVIDKNPIYSLHTGVLKSVFPDAKFIVLVRNYKDNALSRKKYAYSKRSIFELGVAWEFYYEKIMADAERYGLSPHFIRYEDLVSSPEDELRKICRYLGVDFDPAMLDHKEKAKAMKAHLQETTSGEKFEQVMHMHANLESEVSTQRIKAYEKELSAEENTILDNLCLKMGKRFGYSEGNKGSASAMKALFYKLKMRTYLLWQNLYYALPVGLRLIFLKRKQ